MISTSICRTFQFKMNMQLRLIACLHLEIIKVADFFPVGIPRHDSSIWSIAYRTTYIALDAWRYINHMLEFICESCISIIGLWISVYHKWWSEIHMIINSHTLWIGIRLFWISWFESWRSKCYWTRLLKYKGKLRIYPHDYYQFRCTSSSVTKIGVHTYGCCHYAWFPHLNPAGFPFIDHHDSLGILVNIFLPSAVPKRHFIVTTTKLLSLNWLIPKPSELYMQWLQVQFIDAWHQIWKLCAIFFWMKKSIYVWIYLFAIYVLYLCTEGALSLSNCLDHDEDTMDSKTWFMYCTE